MRWFVALAVISISLLAIALTLSAPPQQKLSGLAANELSAAVPASAAPAPVPSTLIANTFSDYIVSSAEGTSLGSSGAKLYYLYFPAGTAKGNTAPIAILADGKFVREVVGFRVDGDALEFAQGGCASASFGAASNSFASANAFEVKDGSRLCARLASDNGEKFEISVSSATGERLLASIAKR